MQTYLAMLGVVLFFSMLIGRALMMRRKGIKAIVFGETNKSDFFLPPIFIVFVYEVTAVTFSLPKPFGEVANQYFYVQGSIAWIGVTACFLGLVGFYLCLKSFGDSFRVGIDEKNPDKLVTTGIYAISRNPIYVSFAIFFLGMFLIIPNLIMLLILITMIMLFHRQVLREEKFLNGHYGNEYVEYCKRVRRYL